MLTLHPALPHLQDGACDQKHIAEMPEERTEASLPETVLPPPCPLPSLTPGEAGHHITGHESNPVVTVPANTQPQIASPLGTLLEVVYLQSSLYWGDYNFGQCPQPNFTKDLETKPSHSHIPDPLKLCETINAYCYFKFQVVCYAARDNTSEVLF